MIAREHIAAVLLLVSGLLCGLLPHQAGGLLLHGVASRAALGRVDESLERNQDTFLALSAAKAAAAVVEGSGVGVGFELQIGDLIQPIFDLLHFFWRMLLFSLLLLGAYKLLLETGILGLGFSVLGAGLLLWGASLLRPGVAGLRATARFLTLGGLLLAYLVPAALLSTWWLSNHYTRDLEVSYRQDITRFGEDLERARDSVLDPEQKAPWYKPGERIDDLRTRLVAAGRFVSERLDQSLLSFTFYSLLLLFDYLVLPFASAWLLYRVALLAFGRLLPPG